MLYFLIENTYNYVFILLIFFIAKQYYKNVPNCINYIIKKLWQVNFVWITSKISEPMEKLAPNYRYVLIYTCVSIKLYKLIKTSLSSLFFSYISLSLQQRPSNPFILIWVAQIQNYIRAKNTYMSRRIHTIRKWKIRVRNSQNELNPNWIHYDNMHNLILLNDNYYIVFRNDEYDRYDLDTKFLMNIIEMIAIQNKFI